MVSSMMMIAQPPRRRPVAPAHADAPDDGAKPPVAFVCPCCKQQFGDPMYHGPVGHAPQELCFDCWASEWAQMGQVISRGGSWQPMDAALFLLCQGFTHQEAADMIGVHRNSVYGWIRQIRRCPGMTPEWIFKRAEFRRGVRS